MAMEPLPLFVGDGTDAALFSSSFWSFQDDELHQPQESVAELKQSLVATTVELEAAKEELKKKEQSIAKLADLVRQVANERDEARDQLQHLLLLAATAPAPAPAPRVTSSFTDSDCSLVPSSPVDPFFDPVVTSADKRCGGGKPSPAAATPPTPPPLVAASAARQQQQQPVAGSAADAMLDMIASKRPLPQKGRLLAAVMEAGPRLWDLLVAGQLPQWRNPPTTEHAPPDALPLGARRAGYVSGATMAGGGGAAALGYGGANNACMKRPVSSMLPLTPSMGSAVSNCSPCFIAKRVRLH